MHNCELAKKVQRFMCINTKRLSSKTRSYVGYQSSKCFPFGWEHCSIVGLVKAQVNQFTNEPMYSEQVQRQKVQQPQNKYILVTIIVTSKQMMPNVLPDAIASKIDFTVSRIFQKYFNFVPMLESRNGDHVKSNCLWDMFLWKNSGGLHTFMRFSKIFQLCTILESRNVDHMKSNCSWDMFLWKNSGGLQNFMRFSKIFQLCTHARIM